VAVVINITACLAGEAWVWAKPKRLVKIEISSKQDDEKTINYGGNYAVQISAP